MRASAQLPRLDLKLELDDLGLPFLPVPGPQLAAKLGHQGTFTPMLETDAFVSRSKLDGAHRAVCSLVEPIR